MNYQINLSSGELYTLAGLLRFNCLYGIERDTLVKWQDDLQRHIRYTVNRLENRKLIFFELYGRLQIQENLKTVIELIACPDNMIIVSGNARNGRTSTMYIFEKNGTGVTVSRLDEDNYKIVMYSSDKIVALICNNYIRGMSEPFCEKMLLEDAEYIQGKIAAFQVDEAKKRLSKCLTDPENSDFVYKVMEKNADFTEARFLKRKNDFYETTFDLLVSYDADHSVTLDIDEHEVLSLNSLNKESVDKMIGKFFEKIKERNS